MGILSVLGLRVASVIVAGWLDRLTRYVILGAVAIAVIAGGRYALHLWAESVRREAQAELAGQIKRQTDEARAAAQREGEVNREEVERIAREDEAALRREALKKKGVRDAADKSSGVGGVVFRADDEWLRAKRDGAARR